METCAIQETCLIKGSRNEYLSSRISDAKPPATLTWYLRSNGGDKRINSSESSFLTNDNITFTTVSKVPVSIFGNISVVLLVCKSTHITFDKNFEQLVLVDLSTDERLFLLESEILHYEITSRAILKCSERYLNGYYIWKKEEDDRFKTIAFRVSNHVNVIKGEPFYINQYGDLVIGMVELNHEGYYACLADYHTRSDVVEKVQLSVVGKSG